MTDEATVSSSIEESRREWFSMLVSYIKLRTYALWMHYYPETSEEEFELIWPVLFDRMLDQATDHALRVLKVNFPISLD